MDFRVTFYDTTKYENICTIFKLYKPRSRGYRYLYPSYRGAYWREEGEPFYGWWRCIEAMNFLVCFIGLRVCVCAILDTGYQI